MMYTDNGKYKLTMYNLDIVCKKWLNRLSILSGTIIHVDNYRIDSYDTMIGHDYGSFILEDICIRLEGNTFVCEIPEYVDEVFFDDLLDEKLCRVTSNPKDYNFKVIHKEGTGLNYTRTMGNIFEGITVNSFDLSEFSTKGCRDMRGMFMYSTIYNGLDLTSFDTLYVESIGCMFEAKIHGDLDLSSFDLDNCKDSIYMFDSSVGMTDGLVLVGGKVLLSHKQTDVTLDKIIKAAKHKNIQYAFKD